MTGLNLDARINLAKAEVMLLDESLEGMSILMQIVLAFGVRSVRRSRTVDEAKKMALSVHLDLILVGANGHDSSGYDFVRWLRRSGMDNAFVPTILISGHTPLQDVQRARDCGANYIVAKPISPEVLLERILWVAREKRSFIACESYVGPDRRFHDVGPPGETPERRHIEPEPETPALEPAH
jgi:DNA-binding response OmpR family regulator